jgi:hypothetical protein
MIPAIAASVLAATVLNQRRVDVLMKPFGFMLLAFTAVLVFVNGSFTRETQSAIK